MRSLFSFVLVLILVPSDLFASVRINEVAWQGYLGDANNEWIELYNEGGGAIVLDGWLLEADDGTPSVNLSGISVSSSGYVLLERTDDTSVPEETGDVFYSGALGNEGEKLVLKNADGQIIDTLDASSGWGDMESSSTGTYSWINGTWKEGVATPKAVNEAIEGDEESDEENEDESGETSSSKSSTGDTAEEKKPSYKERLLSVQAPTQGVVGVPLSFSSHLRDFDGDTLKRGLYVWNMGDGRVLYRTNDEEFVHTYEHAGEYVVFVSYNKSTFGKEPEELEPDSFDEHVITISDSVVEVVSVVDGGTVTLKNNASFTINLEDWVITNNEERFVVPKNTFVRKGKEITFSKTTTKISHNPLFVINPSGLVVASSEKREASTRSGEVLGVSAKSFSVVEDDSSEELVYETSNGNASVTETPLTASVGTSHGSQKTLYMLLFVFVGLFAGILVWLLVSSRPKKQTVEGYEIIED